MLRGMTRPLIGLCVGDPAGIGPEISLAAVADKRVEERLRVVLFGPAALRPAHIALVKDPSKARGQSVSWFEVAGPAKWQMGQAQAACGGAAIAALYTGHMWAQAGSVDALVTAPVSKAALHMAGEKVEGQTELLARWCKVSDDDCEMIALAHKLRVMLLTRHLPLLEAIGCIEPERIAARLGLFGRTLGRMGIDRPRLAVAGLNPHAGEGGILGSEDDELVRPGVELARAAGWDVAGPISPDSVFLEASRGRYDGVLALYHDQAFIPVKLHAPDSGLTLVAGLPYLRISPAHGTAFDIAGKGLARAENLVGALLSAAEWGRGRAEKDSHGPR